MGGVRHWVSILAAILVLADGVPRGSSATKRELAEKRYQAAAQLYEDLQQIPRPELGQRQYEIVIAAFRKVPATDPASGYCDDALLAVAELYTEMAERYASGRYRSEAVRTYQFLAREYPHSKHRAEASAMAVRLEHGEFRAGEPTVAASPAPAAASPGAALSDSRHPRDTVVQPPSPLRSGALASISELRHHSYADGTRIVLAMEGQTALKYDFLQHPQRLYIDIFNSVLADELIQGAQVRINDGLLSTVRLAQNRRNKARMVLELKQHVSFDVFWLASPLRCVLDIRKSGAPRPPRTLQALAPPSEPPAPRAAVKTSDGRHSLIRALGLKLDRVLIDAGHGGHDTGSIGPGGLQEKDVVLDIVRRLGPLLRDRLGTEVIYTREADVFVPLEERTRIANERQADLMLSIHCNSASNSGVRGIETYYLNFTSDDWELSVASLENASANRSIHQLADLVSQIALDEKIEESREFASRVHQQLYRGVSRHSSSIRDRGVRKAPFVVLVGAQMPAVLAEIGFISNRFDESLMRRESFRAEVAEHLYAGIAAYAESLGTLALKGAPTAGSSQRD